MDAMVRWILSAAIALPAAALCRIAGRCCSRRPASDARSNRRPIARPRDAGHAGAVAQKLNEPMPIGPAGRESSDPGAAHGGHHDAPATASSGPAFLSMFGSLAIVIGLFLGLVWLLRRGSPKAARLLSSDVVELLGRSPLAGRQQMHVIRFGNRLLLVAVSPDGAKTLAEITDPVEVDRLAGLCQQAQTNSATHAFRQIFGQLADIRRPGQLDAAASAGRGGGDRLARIGPLAANGEDDDV